MKLFNNVFKFNAVVLCALLLASVANASQDIYPPTPVPLVGLENEVCFDLKKPKDSYGTRTTVIKGEDLTKIVFGGKAGGANKVVYYYKITKIRYVTKNEIPADATTTPPTPAIPAGTERIIDLPDTTPTFGAEVKLDDLPGGIKDGSKICFTIKTFILTSQGFIAATGNQNGENHKVNATPSLFSPPMGGPTSALPGTSGGLLTTVAASVLGLSAGDVATPDLMLVSEYVATGKLKFVPSDGIRFNSNHTHVYVLTDMGVDVTDKFTFDQGTVKSDGSYEIDVQDIDFEGIGDFEALGIIVRGVEFDQANLQPGVIGGYVAAGDSLTKFSHGTNLAPLQVGNTPLANWQTVSPAATAKYTGHVYSFPDSMGGSWQEPGIVGGAPHVFSGTNGIGHLINISVETLSAGSFSDGVLFIQPIDSARFVESAETLVYFFDAVTNENLTGSFQSALAVNSRGAIKIDVTGFTGTGISDRLIRVVVRGPKVAFDAPMFAGQTERVIIHGSMIKVPVASAITIIEGGDPDAPQGLLVPEALPGASTFPQ